MRCPHCARDTAHPGRVHGTGICAPAIRACACGVIAAAEQFAGTEFCRNCRAIHEQRKSRARAMNILPRTTP